VQHTRPPCRANQATGPRGIATDYLLGAFVVAPGMAQITATQSAVIVLVAL